MSRGLNARVISHNAGSARMAEPGIRALPERAEPLKARQTRTAARVRIGDQGLIVDLAPRVENARIVARDQKVSHVPKVSPGQTGMSASRNSAGLTARSLQVHARKEQGQKAQDQREAGRMAVSAMIRVANPAASLIRSRAFSPPALLPRIRRLIRIRPSPSWPR